MAHTANACQLYMVAEMKQRLGRTPSVYGVLSLCMYIGKSNFGPGEFSGYYITVYVSLK